MVDSPPNIPIILGLLTIVEQVMDGTTLRVRLIIPDGDHERVNIALAGIRSANIFTTKGKPSEPWDEKVNRSHISHLGMRLSSSLV